MMDLGEVEMGKMLECRDGEGGESVPIKPNSGPESGEGSSVEFVSLGFGKSCNAGRGG
jgi:hypothetical protein